LFQYIWSKIQAIGLQKRYTEDVTFVLQVPKLPSITYDNKYFSENEKFSNKEYIIGYRQFLILKIFD